MTKVDLIKGAFSRCRISGITSVATPEETRLALDRLEDMAAVWEEAHILTGYNFEDRPLPNTTHNLKRAYRSAYQANLALLLLADFGKQPHPGLIAEAASTFARTSASTALVNQVPYPSRMPVGAGNTLKSGRWQRYYGAVEALPAESIQMYVGDIKDFTEDFSPLLGYAETIASFTIVASSGITITSSSLSSPVVNYRVTAGTELASASVVITATSSTGRVETKVLTFLVNEVPNA